jgi:hypothetical protein
MRDNVKIVVQCFHFYDPPFVGKSFALPSKILFADLAARIFEIKAGRAKAYFNLALYVFLWKF